eukprot:ANDGO_01134.mRNA.1 Cytochrome b5
MGMSFLQSRFLTSVHDVVNAVATEAQAAATAPASATPKKQVLVLTRDEISKHCTQDDCWLIIRSKVYNVTDYVVEHPGGAIICQDAGKDSTASFDDIGHSEDAIKLLEKYYIGELAPNS